MPIIKSITAMCAITCLFLGQGVYAQEDGHLIILQYHHISDRTPHSTSTRPKDFIKHLELIEEMGLPVVELASALKRLYKHGRLKHTSVAITFDDGFRSVYTQAFEPLKKRGWPFTIFVNPVLVDLNSTYSLNWQQLEKLKQHGATIANHGKTHAYLLNKPKNLSWNEWLESEITQAQKRIEKKLGKTPKILAYAYGEFNTKIANWLAKKGYLAVGQHSGPASHYSHPQAIPRFPAGGNHASIKALKEKLNSLAPPIAASQWQNPVLSSNPPLLRIDFISLDVSAHSVQCYSNSEGAIPTYTTNSDGNVQIQARNTKPITAGRDRYNCTLASKTKKDKYYWYSQLWINTQVMPR